MRLELDCKNNILDFYSDEDKWIEGMKIEQVNMLLNELPPMIQKMMTINKLTGK